MFKTPDTNWKCTGQLVAIGDPTLTTYSLTDLDGIHFRPYILKKVLKKNISYVVGGKDFLSEVDAYNYAVSLNCHTASISLGNKMNPTTEKHPLEHVFAAALERASKGKGSQRHGTGTDGKAISFMEQRWFRLSAEDAHGYKSLTYQAAKKVEEANTTFEEAAWEREVLDAIVYLSMAILRRRATIKGSISESLQNANNPSL